MARSLPPTTWENGFAEPATIATWADGTYHLTERKERAHYAKPPSQEPLTSVSHNCFGLNVLRTWPTLYNGTMSPHGKPDWWQPSSQVDVLICGAGPFGLEVALSLARQGISFRIIDKAEAPLLAGRADAIHPRALELLHSWGLAEEFHEEGPILDHTAIFRDGKKVFYDRSSQSDSRYRGLHVITQGQAERIYIRDLLRHKHLVERCSIVEGFDVQDPESDYPINATTCHTRTGVKEDIRAKYLIGADGASSSIREQLNISFDGNTTDIYWAITDAIFETDYPYITSFGFNISSEHGACIIVPREYGYTRIYTQISGERAKQLAQRRQEKANASAVGETRVIDHDITVEEVLELTNKNFAPFKVKFSGPISWFAVWKVSERVARSFSSADLRVHIGGDAAHVHSVLGAFGFNSSIYDASNLGWKLGLCVRNLANPSSLLPTYDQERRLFANRVVRCSGTYLRYLCNSSLPLAALRGLGEELEKHEETLPTPEQTVESDKVFLRAFFKRNAKFLLGVETPIVPSVICQANGVSDTQRPTTILAGARAPNPRVCLENGLTSYLYDKMMGASRFHILVFCSDLQGPVRAQLKSFSRQTFGCGGFFGRFRGSEMFNIVLIVKAPPHELENCIRDDSDLVTLRNQSSIVFDDRAPDEDAHYWYGINHARGGVIVVRPDLWVGTSVWPEQSDLLKDFFGQFVFEAPVVQDSKLQGKSQILHAKVKQTPATSISHIGAKRSDIVISQAMTSIKV